MKTSAFYRDLPVLAGFLAGLGLFVGCSSSGGDGAMPATHPVTGSLTTEKGQPYKGGNVQFRSEKDPDLTVTGEVGEDGSFRLHTIKGTNKAEGAPAGTYQVTIMPAIGADQKMAFQPFTAPKKYEIQAKDNRIDIKVDPPAK